MPYCGPEVQLRLLTFLHCEEERTRVSSLLEQSGQARQKLEERIHAAGDMLSEWGLGMRLRHYLYVYCSYTAVTTLTTPTHIN